MPTSSRQSALFGVQDWKKLYQSYREADFASYDYETLRKSFIDYLTTNYPETFNDYIESSEFIALLDVMAFMGQALAFRSDLNARENFIDTAERRDSVIKLANLVSYTPKRNTAGQGVLKITAVQTTEDIRDINGTALANIPVQWNDPANPYWQTQYNSIINSALVSSQYVGKPGNSKDLLGIKTDEYTVSIPDGYLPIVPFVTQVDAADMNFELVSVTSLNQNYLYELPPAPNGTFNILYQNDKLGYASANTGWFVYFKQGRLQNLDFAFAEAIENSVQPINIEGINNSDTWLYELTSSGTTGDLWRQVESVYASAALQTENSQRKIYSVTSRVNDQVTYVFGDGVFSKIPVGNFRAYVRSGNALKYIIDPVEMQGITVNIGYLSRSNRVETLTLTLNLQLPVNTALTRETLTQIRERAPARYYTQNRMVNGEDYTNFPYTLYNSIIKSAAVNRTSVGVSRNLDLLDPTGKYSSTNVFADDGSLWQQNNDVANVPTTATTFSLSNINFATEFLTQNFQTILGRPECIQYYYRYYDRYSGYYDPATDKNAYWHLSTVNSDNVTGYFYIDIPNQGEQPITVGELSGTDLKYISTGALLKFIPGPGYTCFDRNNRLKAGPYNPALGDKQYIWAGALQVIDDGSNFGRGNLENGSGPVTLSEYIPTGAIIERNNTDVVSIASDRPMVVTTSTPHGLEDGDAVRFQNINIGTNNPLSTSLNNATNNASPYYASVTGYSPTTFAVYTTANLTTPLDFLGNDNIIKIDTGYVSGNVQVPARLTSQYYHGFPEGAQQVVVSRVEPFEMNGTYWAQRVPSTENYIVTSTISSSSTIPLATTAGINPGDIIGAGPNVLRVDSINQITANGANVTATIGSTLTITHSNATQKMDLYYDQALTQPVTFANYYTLSGTTGDGMNPSSNLALTTIAGISVGDTVRIPTVNTPFTTNARSYTTVANLDTANSQILLHDSVIYGITPAGNSVVITPTYTTGGSWCSGGTVFTPPDAIIPSLDSTLSNDTVRSALRYIQLKLNFALKFDNSLPSSLERWSIVSPIPTTNVTPESYFMKFEYDQSNDSYYVRYHTLRYFFGSVQDVRFFFETVEKVFDSRSGQTIADYINIQGTNTNVLYNLPLGQDYVLDIVDQSVQSDGYTNDYEVQVSSIDQDTGFPIDPDFFKIIAPTTADYPLVFFENVEDSQGLISQQIVPNDTIVIAYPTFNTVVGAVYEYPPNTVFYTDTTTISKVVNNITSASPGVITTATTHGFVTGQRVVFSGLTVTPNTGTTGIQPIANGTVYYVQVLTTTTFSLRRYSVTSGLTDPINTLGWTIAVSSATTVSTSTGWYESNKNETTNVLTLYDVTNNYSVEYGRGDIIFQYRHNSNNTTRIDPSTSNIIDLYLVTQGYYTDYTNWLADTTGVLTEPLVPTINELTQLYGQVDDYKMVSDNVVLNSVRFKPLFGQKASPTLRGTLKIVKSPLTTASDSQVRSSCLTALNSYFSLDKWNFGDTFYFSELSAYLHAVLGDLISSVVVVPSDPNQSFGDLYEIRSAPYEIFVNGATANDIIIVSSLNSNTLQQR